jgi:hypothetical protein
MRNIMLAPLGAPPSTTERISYFQVEVLDAHNSRVGVINTDAMALVLQEFGFAVLDTQKTTELSFGQAVFFMRQGKRVRRKNESCYYYLDKTSYDPEVLFVIYPDSPNYNNSLNHLPVKDILARDWEIVSE